MMFLDLAWLIPGLPIMASIFIIVLLISFSKTMNRLTKPASYFIIISLACSEIINFIFLKKNISGDNSLFGGRFNLFLDQPSLIFAESIGILLLLVMLLSVTKLKRRNGYVRYFALLGLLSGSLYLFSFSGSLFHDFYDPLISYIDKSGNFI